MLSKDFDGFGDYLQVAPSTPGSSVYVVKVIPDDETNDRIWEERGTVSETLCTYTRRNPDHLYWNESESGFVVATVSPEVRQRRHLRVVDNNHPLLDTSSPAAFAEGLAEQLEPHMGFAAAFKAAL